MWWREKNFGKKKELIPLFNSSFFPEIDFIILDTGLRIYMHTLFSHFTGRHKIPCPLLLWTRKKIRRGEGGGKNAGASAGSIISAPFFSTWSRESFCHIYHFGD
jgi:hypothetical protein